MFSSLLFDADRVFVWLTHAAWQATLLAIVVLTLTWLCGRRLQPRWRFALWLVVFARLATPVLPEASWSVFRIVSLAGAPQAAAVVDSPPTLPERIADSQMNLRTEDSRGAKYISQANPQRMHESAEAPANRKAAATLSEGNALFLCQLAVLIWLAGVVALALHRLANLVQLHRQQRRWQEITDPNILSVLHKCSVELRFFRRVSLCTTPDNLGPATCGVVRPRIVLPRTLLERLSREELRLVLLHELVHVRRHDVLVDQLAGLVTIVHWFHPVAWISCYFLRRERELACDAAVLEQSPTANAAEYGHVILKTIESLTVPLPGLVGMFSRGPSSLVHRRIRMIAAYRRSNWPSPVFGGVLLAALVLVGLTDAQTVQQQADPAQKSAVAPPSGVPAQDIQPAKTDNDAKKQSEPVAANAATTREIRQHPLTVTGKAVDQHAKPIAGATILLLATNSSPGKVIGQTKTDRDGRYEFRNEELPYYPPEKNDHYEQGTFQVFGSAPGVGFAWHGMRFLFIDPRFVGMNRQASVVSPSYGYLPGEAIDLDLVFLPATPIRGRIVDDQGRPIQDVKVSLTNCDYLDTAGKEAKQPYRELGDAVEQVGRALPDQVKCVSDAEGRFELKSVPEGIVCRLAMQHPEYGIWEIWTGTADSLPKQYDGEEVHPLPIEMTRQKTRSISVQVHYADTRGPAIDALVGAYVHLGTNNAWGKSDKQGKVALKLPPGEYTVWSHPPQGADYLKVDSKFLVRPTDDEQSVDLTFDRACVLMLKAIDKATGAGVENVTFWYEKESQPGKKWSVQSSDTTNDFPATNVNGELRIIVHPGTRRYGIGFNPLRDNYQADNGDKTVGRELTLPPGHNVTAEFYLQR